MGGRIEIAGRTWVVLATGALLSVLLLTLLVVSGRSLLARGPDCSVTVGGRTSELTTEQAQRVSAADARAIRRGEPVELAPASLTCSRGGAGEPEPDRLGPAGLTARAERVRRDLDRTFGRQQVGGFAPGGVREGHMPGSAHYSGRAIDVFVRPVAPRNKVRGWAIAHHLVANAERLAVDTVIFDGRIWTARRATEGWRPYRPDTAGRPRRVARVLEHRDHVHVDVAD